MDSRFLLSFPDLKTGVNAPTLWAQHSHKITNNTGTYCWAQCWEASPVKRSGLRLMNFHSPVSTIKYKVQIRKDQEMVETDKNGNSVKAAG